MPELSRKLVVLGVGLALVSASCSDNAVVDTPDTRVEEIRAGIPPEQRDAYEDGTVDTNEYQAAFGLFRECANTDESLVVNVQVDPVSGYVGYGVKGDLSIPGPSNGTALDDCYQRYFSWIEATWQTTDPGALEMSKQVGLDFFEQVVRPCLEANGVEVPDEVIPGTDEFGELSRQGFILDTAGKCESE